MRLSKQHAEEYRRLADEYAASHDKDQYEAAHVVSWAIGQGELSMSPEDVAEYHRERLSEALRSETKVDGKGRIIRTRHCVTNTARNSEGRPVQQVLWGHLDSAPVHFLRSSLDQRRNRICADVAALRADVDAINERFTKQKKPLIQMSFNFDGDPSAQPRTA